MNTFIISPSGLNSSLAGEGSATTFIAPQKNSKDSIPPSSQDCSFLLGLGLERPWVRTLKERFINFDWLIGENLREWKELIKTWYLPKLWIIYSDHSLKMTPFIHSFIQTIFYRASSSPLLLRIAPDAARILCRSFTPKRHILLIS